MDLGDPWISAPGSRDGHRSFTHIGIAVYLDSSGTVWLTQDFSN
ncbi:MAG: hypothetical protein ACLPKE_27195 [Streptosporangiaceae bacterium]